MHADLRGIELEDVDSGGRGKFRLVDIAPVEKAPALQALLAARLFNPDTAHGFRGGGEKMGSGQLTEDRSPPMG